MATDYGYPNARIRAMKSLLFRRPFYEKLLMMSDLHEVATTLGKTDYGRDMDQAMIKYGGIKGFDEALRTNVMRTFRKILKFMDGEARELVSILTGRWDIANLKTILRGKNIGASSEDIISSLVPAGALDDMTLNELARQPEIRQCIDLMATWRMSYAGPLTEAFPEYAKKRSMTALELALDRAYYENAFEKLRGRSMNVALVREVLLREIDLTNIMTALQVVKDEIEPAESDRFFILGGREIDVKRLQSLVRKATVEDVVYGLHDTSYGSMLQKQLETFFATGSLVRIERSLEEFAVKRGIKMFRGDPLSIALIIGYIWAKYNEVINLRIIARGKLVEMPEEKIREALVLA